MALANVLAWYQQRARLEESRFGLCLQKTQEAEARVERHKEEVLAQRMELIRAASIQGLELATLASFRDRARRQEAQLRRNVRQCEEALELQRKTMQAALLRLRLVEKLHDRRTDEQRHQAARELEDLASESYLAAFARNL